MMPSQPSRQQRLWCSGFRQSELLVKSAVVDMQGHLRTSAPSRRKRRDTFGPEPSGDGGNALSVYVVSAVELARYCRSAEAK